jgi:hypothetical protein
MQKNFQTELEKAKNSGKLQELLNINKTLIGVVLGLGYSNHGRNTKALRTFLDSNNIVFNNLTSNTIEYEDKVCANCGEVFKVSIRDKGEQKKITCSHYCSSNYKEFKEKRVLAKLGHEAKSYPKVAKRYGLNSCCICGEDQVVDIHHLDEDRDNNDISNLVPLCPTHHAYMHRFKSDLIFDRLIEYLDNRNL